MFKYEIQEKTGLTRKAIGYYEKSLIKPSTSESDRLSFK